MYYITIKTKENEEITTYSDTVISINDLLYYIGYFKKQDLEILDLKVEKF